MLRGGIKMSQLYNSKYYEAMSKRNPKIASVMMPIILDVIKPNSVIDFGCGIGSFLVEPVSRGIKVLGIDGEYLNKNELIIPKDRFMAADLSKKIIIKDKFDLALSLEVAEHIENEKAEIFLSNIVETSDIVVFSAAIPYQNGTGHINLQPTSYWCKLFEERGYVASNCLREIFWYKDISALRRQNIMLFTKPDKMEELEEKFKKYSEGPIYDIVHPDFFDSKLNEIKNSYIIELQKQETKFRLFESVIDYIKLADLCSQMSLFEMVDNYKYLAEWQCHEEFMERFHCKQLDDKEIEKNNNAYMIWGAGKDGLIIVKILKLLRKKVSILVDKEKEGQYVENILIENPKEGISQWSREIIILASRKYQKEMRTELNEIMDNYVI